MQGPLSNNHGHYFKILYAKQNVTKFYFWVHFEIYFDEDVEVLFVIL